MFRRATLLSLFFALTLLSFCRSEGRAQTVTSGAIRGVVYEFGTKTPIPGATVTVTNRETGLKRSALSDASGEYFIKMLPVGVYTVNGSMAGFEIVPTSTTSIPVRILDPSVVTPPPVELRRIATAPTTTATTPTGVQPARPNPSPVARPGRPTPPAQPAPQAVGQAATPAPVDESESEQLVNTSNASRTQHFDARQISVLPLPGIRTFDDLAFLAPGVAPPPLAIGSAVGPGVGAGVGTSGQFAVNGIRSRANNFTLDGSDNNDDDIGVRRQGFTTLVPQPIESMQAVQITTLLPEPQLGRSMGAQVNGVSRSGGPQFHGTLYGFLTDRRLKARDPFDFTGGPAAYTLTRADGAPVRIGRVTSTGQVLDVRPLTSANPVEGENPFTRGQYGFVFGGPIVKDRTHFFVSYERQGINASRESHFAVPTVAQRGLFTSGEVGLVDTLGNAVFPTSIQGNAFLSLFPFPNNPIGPYGPATFTQVLPASADGNVFSFKVDQDINAFGRTHRLSGRYNFTNDGTDLPATGEALFSSQRALVGTQNFSLLFDSSVSDRAANQFRLSYGRTRLRFREIRNPFLLAGGQSLTNASERAYLLNAPYIYNASRGRDTIFQVFEGLDTEDFTGPLGQVTVTGYSPIGADVYNFPQARTNNTYQMADTLIYDRSKHRISTGFDVRWVHLNSFVNRNFRPLASFNGAQDLVKVIDPNAPSNNPNGFYFGRDYLAAGAPTGFFQTFARGAADSTIGLRYWQNNIFLADQIRVRPNFTLTLGARYELNTVPREVNRRIENTFNSPEVQRFIAVERETTRSVLGQSISGLETFLAGRFKMYKSDANNIAPHVAFAWDPFKNGKTSIRAGYGIYYDQILGAVISQSRNVFPNFLTINFGGYNPNCVESPTTCAQTLLHRLVAQNPSFTYAKAGTLNQYNGVFDNDPVRAMTQAAFLTVFTTGPGFILPDAHLQTPYAQHWTLSVEREIARDFLLSVAYVGTKSTQLLRVATPNLGPNSPAFVASIFAEQSFPNVPNALFPAFFGVNIPPARTGRVGDLRPFPLTGSFTSIESDANSNYHSMQVQMNKRFTNGVQFTTAYTWSHAIDEVSDLFDLGGTPALPQDSFNRAAERGDANFDTRHRFAYSFIWNLPGYSKRNFLGGWQLASTGSYQTGQPYSVLFCCDQNRDGNASDRISFISSTGADPGVAPRNTFRAQRQTATNLAVNKYIPIGENNRIEVRTEVFNLFNHVNYGIPVNRLFFGNLGIEPLTQKNYYDTRIPARTIQFALKYSF